MICRKCYNRGKVYQIDGSVTIIKPCDCEATKEQQNNFAEWAEKFRSEINEKLLSLSRIGEVDQRKNGIMEG